MERRKLLQQSILSVGLLALSSSNAFSFTHSKLLGGGGGGNWKSIVDDFKGALLQLSKQSGVMGEVIADLADALGLKQQAAIMRAEAKNISEKGDALGADDLDTYREKSDSTHVLIKEKFAAGDKLSAQQKEKMAEAAVKYVPALYKGIEAGIQLSSVASAAAGAGTPDVTDGMDAVTAATDIPVLVPKAIKFVSNSVEVGQSLTAIMRENDVAVPDTDGLSEAMANMTG